MTGRHVWPVLAGGLFLMGPSVREAEPPAHADLESSAAGEVVYVDQEPWVVDPRHPEPVELRVATSDAVDAVRLELDGGGSVAFAPIGKNLYSAILTPAQVLRGYGPEDMQHNFMGFLDVYRGGTRLARFNRFAAVADEAVPDVAVETLAPGVQATPHVLAVFQPGIFPGDVDVREAARRLYQFYPDAYDFLSVVSVPDAHANRHHIGVRNAVKGTGVSPFDNGASYGSRARLLGINRYPLTNYFDLGESTALHETGHQWIAFTSVPLLATGRPHWPISSLGRGIMGISPGGGQGLNLGYDFVSLGSGEYRLMAAEPATSFNDMELYLMGLLPAEAVGPHFVFPDQKQTLCGGCVLRGAQAVTVADVIAAHGPRVPAYPDAPRDFTMATVVVSTTRPLTPREMAFFDYFAARGEAQQPLSFTSGFGRGTTLPFGPATGGRGSLTTRLGPRL
jgi:hypothetical protein